MKYNNYRRLTPKYFLLYKMIIIYQLTGKRQNSRSSEKRKFDEKRKYEGGSSYKKRKLNYNSNRKKKLKQFHDLIKGSKEKRPKEKTISSKSSLFNVNI